MSGRRPLRRMIVVLGVVGFGVLAAACESEPASAQYSEIRPTAYIAGANCGLSRLTDDPTTAVVGGRRLSLAVCARVRASGDWRIVDGEIDVEHVTGEARVGPAPPADRAGASAFAGAPWALAKLAVGVVRVTVSFGDMTGAGVLDIVEG